MENTVIRERLCRLRAAMARKHIDYYLIPTADFHSSEYVADHFKVREYFCGFTGSNGTLVVSDDWAGLWTDGRYYIQAERELEGTGVVLFRMTDEGVPTINEYLKGQMRSGETLAFDGRVVSAKLGGGLREDLEGRGVKLLYAHDLAEEAWIDRPALPQHPLFLVGREFAGRSAAEKLSDVRGELEKKNADAWLCSGLDDICWLFNIRGNDVACSPVALSYVFVTQDAATLFIQQEELTSETNAYFDRIGVIVRDYGDVLPFLERYDFSGHTVLYDRSRISYALMEKLKERTASCGGQTMEGADPTLVLKAVKNETELKNIHEVYLRDSAVLCKFLWWIKKNAGRQKITECSAAEKLDGMRAELPGFIELSFPSISAYGANAAMMHYEPSPTEQVLLDARGMYLIDSGGTYYGGTTDVTRTVVLGEISEEMRTHFTAVAAGVLRLANARFLRGCTGRNLDILAREPVWELNIDYKCGTGHGVGYMLNVHEGPHSIRWKRVSGEEEAELLPGMLVSDEPGVYMEGSHGIRTENILEVVTGEKNENGQFLEFRTLTWVPVDLDGIDPERMEARERRWLNEYHREVYERVAPLIEEEEIRDWLREATREI